MTTRAVLDRVSEWVAAHREESITQWADWIRQPSVSSDGTGFPAATEHGADLVRRSGLTPEVIETGGRPLILGHSPDGPPGTPHVLIYGHYDVQPPGPLADWHTPPFEPDIRDGRMYGRGTGDNKGQHLAQLLGLRALHEVSGSLPCRVTVLLDGEEEIGSPFFGSFTEAHRELLAADVVIVTDGPKHASGRATIMGGARGVMKLELLIEGARRDVHSGNYTVPNPAWALNGLLASMATPDGTPLIEGFEEDVVGPTSSERSMMAAVPLDLPGLEKELGVRLPADYLERLMFHPTLTIRGLSSGFVGALANTIIPHRATVALDIRMVKNQRWDKVYRRVIDHIRAQGFTVLESPEDPLPDDLRGRAVRVVDRGGYDPAKTSLDLPISREIIAVIERAHRSEPAVLMPTAGGSVPIWAFTDILKLPTLLVPYANANNRQHSPNEHLRLDHLFQGARTTAQLLAELGQIASPS